MNTRNTIVLWFIDPHVQRDDILGGYSNLSPHTPTATDGGGGESKPKVPRSVQISILGGGLGGSVLESQNPKCQDLSKFQLEGGGCSGKSKPKVPWSVQISMGGGVFCKIKPQSATICQNFNSFGGRGGGAVFWKVKTQSAKICPNFNFWGRGVFWKVKTQSQDLSKFQLGGGVLESQNPKCQDLSKFQILGVEGGRVGGWLGGGVLESQNPKCQDLSKFQLGGGGVFWTKFQNRGVLCNLVKNFRKPSLPVGHR